VRHLRILLRHWQMAICSEYSIFSGFSLTLIATILEQKKRLRRLFVAELLIMIGIIMSIMLLIIFI